MWLRCFISSGESVYSPHMAKTLHVKDRRDHVNVKVRKQCLLTVQTRDDTSVSLICPFPIPPQMDVFFVLFSWLFVLDSFYFIFPFVLFSYSHSLLYGPSPLPVQVSDLPHITSYPTSPILAHLLLVLLLFLSRIRPPVLVPEPLAGVPWVSSSDRCSLVCSLVCSSGCAASLRHGPEPLRGMDRHRGRKQGEKNSFRVTAQKSNYCNFASLQVHWFMEAEWSNLKRLSTSFEASCLMICPNLSMLLWLILSSITCTQKILSDCVHCSTRQHHFSNHGFLP